MTIYEEIFELLAVTKVINDVNVNQHDFLNSYEHETTS